MTNAPEQFRRGVILGYGTAVADMAFERGKDWIKEFLVFLSGLEHLPTLEEIEWSTEIRKGMAKKLTDKKMFLQAEVNFLRKDVRRLLREKRRLQREIEKAIRSRRSAP